MTDSLLHKYFFEMPRLVLPCILALASASWLSAQQVEVNMAMYRCGENVANSLQQRLLDGGPEAIQAMKKVPGLVSRGQMKLDSHIDAVFLPGERIETSSSKKKHQIKIPDHNTRPIVDGLELELEAYCRKDGKLISLRTAVTHGEKPEDWCASAGVIRIYEVVPVGAE